MKILALGHEFADERIESISFGDPDTILEYDVVLWWPGDVLREYWSSERFQGKPSLSESASFRIREDAQRRRDEINQFLELGRILMIFLPQPTTWAYDTGEREYSGTGRNRAATALVKWMSIDELMPVDLGLVAARGEEIAPVDSGPVPDFWRNQKDIFYYDAYMKTPVGKPQLVIKGTDHAVGALGVVQKTILITLPQPNLEEPRFEWEDDEGESLDEPRYVTDDDEEGFVDALIELVRELRPQDIELPAWAERYALTGEGPELEGLRKASDQLTRAKQRLAKAEARLARLRMRKALFGATGAALEQAVDEALNALGFKVSAGPPGRTDRVAQLNSDEAVLEIKGVDKSAAEKHAAQLQKWVSERHAETGKEPKGILVVNAWRKAPLDRRTREAFPDQMLKYAERQGHCLVTGLQLLCAWLDVETNPGHQQQVARSLLTTVGRWDRYKNWQEWVTPLGEAEQSGA